jgi:cytochrome bd-type quinol oxidase subunit 2
MEQQNPLPSQPGAKAVRLWYVVVAVSVAAILAFSALAAFFYTQAEDYRESKYRAQFQTVNEMVTFLPVANTTVATMLDTDEDNGIRRAASLSGTRILELLAGDALSLAVMYVEDDERHAALFALGGAFSGVAALIFEGYEALSGPAHDLTGDQAAALRTATGIMTAVLGYLQQGLVSGVDGIAEPYHVVAGMPIDSISSAAQALDAAVS